MQSHVLDYASGDVSHDHYNLVIEIVNRCGWDYQVQIKSDGCYGLESD